MRACCDDTWNVHAKLRQTERPARRDAQFVGRRCAWNAPRFWLVGFCNYQSCPGAWPCFSSSPHMRRHDHCAMHTCRSSVLKSFLFSPLLVSLRKSDQSPYQLFLIKLTVCEHFELFYWAFAVVVVVVGFEFSCIVVKLY